MRYKRQSLSYSSQTWATKLTCLVVHWDAHLSYKCTKFRKLCFNGHPRYTSTNIHKHTLFLYFSDFSFFYLFFLWKTNKAKLKTTKTKTWKRNTQSIKLDWLKKRKQDKPVMHKQKGKREKKWLNHFEPFFLSHLGRTFLLHEPLILRRGGRIETVQIRKDHKGFKKISQRSKRGWKLILVSKREDTIALLSD